jgi:hypothetical protein
MSLHSSVSRVIQTDASCPKFDYKLGVLYFYGPKSHESRRCTAISFSTMVAIVWVLENEQLATRADIERQTCDLRLATWQDLRRRKTSFTLSSSVYKLIVHPVNFLFGAMFLLSAGSCTKHICKALAQLW